MTQARIPVDLTNPGQVFACIGLAEAARVLQGNASGGFDWSDPSRAFFVLQAAGEKCPLHTVLTFIREANVTALRPTSSRDELTTTEWSVETTDVAETAPYPIPAPSSPATLPAVLKAADAEIIVDHWGDGTRRDKVKFWAGAGGYPGAALMRDALAAVRPYLDEARLAATADDPLAVSAPQPSSFRFDWRRDYVPLGIGFSLNKHTKMTPLGYPLTEILASIGLGHARPERPDPRDKLVYRYGVPAGHALPLPFLRAALGCARFPVPTRFFRIQMSWPGKEGQARCITDVVEES